MLKELILRNSQGHCLQKRVGEPGTDEDWQAGGGRADRTAAESSGLRQQVQNYSHRVKLRWL